MVVSNEKLKVLPALYGCCAVSHFLTAKYADTQLSSMVHGSLSLYTDCRASEVHDNVMLMQHNDSPSMVILFSFSQPYDNLSGYYDDLSGSNRASSSCYSWLCPL